MSTRGTGAAGRSLMACGRLLGVVCLAALAGASARGASPAQQALVPAQYRSITDAQGFQWDVQHNGQIGNGSNAFHGANTLHINGNNFNPQQTMMTADGNTYVVTGTVAGGVQVQRRVTVKPQAAAVRWVDSFTNPGRNDVTLNATLYTRTYSQCQGVLSNAGNPVMGPFGEDDGGVVLLQTQHHHVPSCVFALAWPKSRVKPVLQNNNNYEFRFAFSLTVEAGETVSLVHALAQRRFNAPPQGKALEKLFGPFFSRSWLKDIPKDLRKALVNARGGLFFGRGGPDLAASLEDLGVERGARDILAIGEETRLRGTASCQGLELRGRFGTTSPPLAELAAVAGRPDDRAQVFLRDGQIVHGRFTAQGLRMVTPTGVELEIDPASLDRLVLREEQTDMTPGSGVRAYVTTIDGNRLALTDLGGAALTAHTAWGRLEVPLAELRWLEAAEEERPGHRLCLKDGSRFFAHLTGQGLPLQSALFGPVELRLAEIVSLVTVAAAAETEEAPEMDQPHVVVAGENLFVGRLDLDTLHLLAPGGGFALAPDRLRTLRNLSAEEGEAGAGAPACSAELWDGGVLTGRLREAVLPVRTGGQVLRVPAADLVSAAVPRPTVPERLRREIAEEIRKLGDDDWQVRDAASRRLGDLGVLAKGQLEAALQRTADPEVRRRAQDLLDAID